MSSTTTPQNKSDRNDAALASTSRSPYSLRRTQTRSDSIAKRTIPLRHRNIRTPRSRSGCPSDSVISSQADRSQSQRSSNTQATESQEEGQEMERSDDESDAPLRAHRATRMINRSSPVTQYFDQVDGDDFLCTICFKVRFLQNATKSRVGDRTWRITFRFLVVHSNFHRE